MSLSQVGPISSEDSLLAQGLSVLADPIYQRYKPEYERFSVGGVEAYFNTSNRSIRYYDFVDDIETESWLISKVIEELDEGDVFYDIGANEGIYTCLVSDHLNDAGRVVAFEPNPESFDILQDNVQRSDIDATPHRIALSDTNGSEMLHVAGKTGHSLADFGTDRERVPVETRRGDDVVAKKDLPVPNVCKIDVEGGEYKTLRGLEETLSKADCRKVYCEVHTEKLRHIDGTPDRIETFLADLGFDLRRLSERGDNYFLEATKER